MIWTFKEGQFQNINPDKMVTTALSDLKIHKKANIHSLKKVFENLMDLAAQITETSQYLLLEEIKHLKMRKQIKAEAQELESLLRQLTSEEPTQDNYDQPISQVLQTGLGKCWPIPSQRYESKDNDSIEFYKKAHKLLIQRNQSELCEIIKNVPANTIKHELLSSLIEGSVNRGFDCVINEVSCCSTVHFFIVIVCFHILLFVIFGTFLLLSVTHNTFFLTKTNKKKLKKNVFFSDCTKSKRITKYPTYINHTSVQFNDKPSCQSYTSISIGTQSWASILRHRQRQ